MEKTIFDPKKVLTVGEFKRGTFQNGTNTRNIVIVHISYYFHKYEKRHFNHTLKHPVGMFSQTLPAKFVAADQPPAPDYSLTKHWSALPFHNDKADVIPKSENWVSDSLKEVDVFYIYPTLYSKGKTWCADVNDQEIK
jgi:hypothetical protein